MKWFYPLLLVLLAACGASTSPSSTVQPTSAPQPSNAPAVTTASGAIPEGRTAEGYHVLGRSDAPVTMTFYSDFFWSTCALHVVETEPQIIKNDIATGKVKLIYRHLMQLGEESEQAAEASECAADQGKFWEFRYQLYAQQSVLYASNDLPATLVQLAQAQGMDGTTFSQCLQSGKHRAEVQADYQAATNAGITSRPVFDINGERLIGALPYSTFQQSIDGAK